MMKKLIKGYFELTKPRITLMVLITTALGYYLGGHGIHDYLHLFVLLSGSALVCSGASALNQYIEREFDGKMHRTKNRPIPSGLIKPEHAFNFGAGISILGVVILYMGCNLC
jgi:protoheme IX farnesyltransferase